MTGGIPAGFEYDSFDDEDEFDDRFEEPRLSSYIPQVKNETQTFAPSIFSKGEQVNPQELEEQVSLRSEDMRMAILKEDIQYVEKALEEGFNPETLMQSGWTALMHAANNACVDIVKLLLERNASANFQKDLFTPLMAVCYSSVRNEDKLVTCAQLLIDAGAKVNVHDRHVMTPLMYAAKLGYSKLVSLLCEQESHIDIQDTQGWTALTFAAANGFSNVIKTLLKYGADYNLTTFDGQKPADIAFSHSFPMLAELLEKYDGENLDQFPAVTHTSSKNNISAKYVKYGDLELFLYGLELGHLIPLMQEHHLQFTDLIKLNESEMVEIGISQLGVRKKLLDSIRDIHTNDWDLSSLSKDQIIKITTLETAAIVANIAKHLKVINASVIYVKKHLHNKREELISDNLVLQKSLVDQCSEALKVSNELQNDVQNLNKDAVCMFPSVDRKPADMIVTASNKSNNIKRLLLPAGIVCVLGATFFSCRIYFSSK